MERVQLHFIITLMAAYWCISAEAHQIAPLTIYSDANGILCPSEIRRENALQLLKDIMSAKISNIISSSLTTEPPTDNITTKPTTTSTTTTTTSVPPVVILQSNVFGGTHTSIVQVVARNPRTFQIYFR